MATGQHTGLTRTDLDRFNRELTAMTGDIDTMSDFSVESHQSALLPKENLFDIRFSTGSFDRDALCLVMQCDSASLAESQFQTLLSVDFYNHESKNSERCDGLSPIYNTVFTFNNQVDDFYMEFLRKEFLNVDVLAVPPNKKGSKKLIKLGSAKIPLEQLIRGDFTF